MWVKSLEWVVVWSDDHDDDDPQHNMWINVNFYTKKIYCTFFVSLSSSCFKKSKIKAYLSE